MDLSKTTAKEVFEGNWIIISIIRSNKNVRINAKRRFRKADEKMFFSEWITEKYASRLYGKSIFEHSKFKY